MNASSCTALRRALTGGTYHGNSVRSGSLVRALSSRRAPGDAAAAAAAATVAVDADGKRTAPPSPTAPAPAPATTPTPPRGEGLAGPGLQEFLAKVRVDSSTSNNSSSNGTNSNSSDMSSPATWNDDDDSTDVDPATAAALRSHHSRSGTDAGSESGESSNKEEVVATTAGSFFIETYGCQMNVSDSEVVRAILLEAGFREADSLEEAGVVLANTCAIRERAEGKVWDRLKFFSSIR